MTETLLQSQTIEFFVPGRARPGGSKKGFVNPRNGRVVIIEDNRPENRIWRNQVAACAKEAYSGPLIEGPVELHVEFVLPRPKGHFGSGRNAGSLLRSARRYPTTKPDTLKLTRALEDALTQVLWRDDAQVVDQHLSKRYGAEPGAHVRVVEL